MGVTECGDVNLDQIRNGDAHAFDELVDSLWAPLCDHLLHVLGSRDLAEDVAQETFVRIWERRERWEGASARALVFRIARNAATDRQRRDKVRDDYASGASFEAARAGSPEDNAVASEARSRISTAVGALPERRRQVFELVRNCGLSYREVAEALDLSEQTVANHLSLALRDLRAELHDLIETESDVDSEVKNNDG